MLEAQPERNAGYGEDKNMRSFWQGIYLSAVVVLSVASVCHAQTATPESEYKKLIRVSEDIQPLGEHPFGENISLYDGSLSFEQTDVSASGNGPLLQLSRKFQIEPDLWNSDRADYAFGDWAITVPHLETLTGSGYYGGTLVSGWQVNGGGFNSEVRHQRSAGVSQVP